MTNTYRIIALAAGIFLAILLAGNAVARPRTPIQQYSKCLGSCGQNLSSNLGLCTSWDPVWNATCINWASNTYRWCSDRCGDNYSRTTN